MKYIIGNWKASKTIEDVKNWCQTFLEEYTPSEKVTVIICSPYPFLVYLNSKLGTLKNIHISAQNISVYEEGSYTGEVTAKALTGIATHTLIGHSERRGYFKETDEELAQKVMQAKKYSLEPVYCVRDEHDPIPEGVKIVAYEPVWAIGTGQNEKLDGVIAMKQKMIHLPQNTIFIYGGSVNEKNINEYLASNEVDGFLPGKASWKPEQFLQLIEACKRT